MNRLIVQAGVWVVLVCVAIADLAWHYPRLPERVASHFDVAGRADGWTTRQSFLLSSLAVQGSVVLLGAGMGWLIRVIPKRFINVPRREFWLAPPREAWTRQAVGDLASSLCALVFCTVVGLNHLTLRANLEANPQLGSGPWWVLGGTYCVMLILIVASTRRFRRLAG